MVRQGAGFHRFVGSIYGQGLIWGLGLRAKECVQLNGMLGIHDNGFCKAPLLRVGLCAFSHEGSVSAWSHGVQGSTDGFYPGFGGSCDLFMNSRFGLSFGFRTLGVLGCAVQGLVLIAIYTLSPKPLKNIPPIP